MVNIPCLDLPPASTSPPPSSLEEAGDSVARAEAMKPVAESSNGHQELPLAVASSDVEKIPSPQLGKESVTEHEYRSFKRRLRSNAAFMLALCMIALKAASRVFIWTNGGSVTIDDGLFIASTFLFALFCLRCVHRGNKNYCMTAFLKEVYVEDMLCVMLTLANAFVLFTVECEKMAFDLHTQEYVDTMMSEMGEVGEDLAKLGDRQALDHTRARVAIDYTSFKQIMLCCATPILVQLLAQSVSGKALIASWGIIVPGIILAIIQDWDVIDSLWVLLIVTTSCWITFEYERNVAAAFAKQHTYNDLTQRWTALEGIHTRAESKIKDVQERFNELLLELSRTKSSADAERKRITAMMGNVAHDLKTPLQSIRMDADVLKSKLVAQLLCGDNKNGEANCFVECTEIIDGFAGTCSFMSMAINRCLDYTKSQYGVGLVPCPETFNLLEAIKVPLKCMRNIQSDIEITLCPIPDSIAAHIISDKHWLCENILCYLSNSVKYSAGGQIEVIVTLENKLRRAVHTGSSRGGGLYNSAVAVRTPRNPTGHVLSRTNSSNGIQNGRVGLQNSGINGRGVSGVSGVSVGVGSSQHRESSPEVAGARSPRNTRNKVTSEDSFVCVTVRDCGIGVPDDKRERLFQPFSQMQSLAGGTGLGLYSLAMRIEALGGNYGCDPRRDEKQGSEFWFAFPYRPDFSSDFEGHQSPRRSMGEPLRVIHSPDKKRSLVKHRRAHSPCTAGLGLGSGAKSPIPSLNILVVDDSPAILKVVGRALTNEGHEVKTAKNGYVGLTMMKESLVAGSLDMVIIDMQMPVMDGLETVTRFREHEARLRYDDFQVDRTVTSESEADLIAPMPSAATAEVSTGQSVEGSLTDLLGGLPPSTVPASAFTPLEVEVMAPSRTNSCGSGGSESSSWEPAEPPLIALSDDVCVASSPALGVTLRNDSAFMNAPKIARRKPDPRMPRDRCHVGVQSKCSTGGMNQNSQPAIPQFPQASRSCAEDLFIVGMSANNNCETQEMALKAGMDAFIVKPFSFKDLEYILRTRNFH